jgi:meckelin
LKKDFNCRCNSNYRFLTNNGGGKITCEACEPGKVQSQDGFSCITCDSTCGQCGSLFGFLTDTNINGQPLSIRSCVECDRTNSIIINNKCTSCQPIIFVDSDSQPTSSTRCNDPNLFQSGGLFILNFNTTLQGYYYGVRFSGQPFDSWYFKENLISVDRTCLRPGKRNVTSCQSLGNMCVLNLYISLSNGAQLDPCRAFNRLPKSDNSNSQDLVWGDNMPWLTYSQTLSVYQTTYAGSGINSQNEFLKISFENKCQSSSLKFYSATYALNGRLLSFLPVDLSEFQLCNYLSSDYKLKSQISPFSATNFNQKCSISVERLLEFGSDPKFYDLYIRYSSNGSNVIPIPVKSLNFIDLDGTEINRNQELTRNHKLQRRFFLVDAISGKTSKDANPLYIRYAKAITIRIDVFNDQNFGQIFPPIIIIDYDYVSVDRLDKLVEVEFSILYEMRLDTQVLAVWVTVGGMSLFAFVYAIIRTWVWNRRSGKLTLDLVSLFKFFMFICSFLGNILLIVMLGLAIYWLIFYKGQGVAFVVLPTSTQEGSFIGLLVGCFLFKLVDVLHLIFTQTSYDVFFIDWERPISDGNSGNIYSNNNNLTGGTRLLRTGEVAANTDKNGPDSKDKLLRDEELKEFNKVSCWRSLFVANEWNEIQTFRKVSPIIQLIALLFFLKVVNLEALTTADCNTSVTRDTNEYQAPYNGILRVAMAASMWILIGITQYFIYSFVYVRCISDRITQFVDFCSVTNISMFIMTHTQFGYYIHGRSPHGNADSSISQMIQALRKEKDDMTGNRGLGPNNNHQTFSILISDKLSKEYAKALNPIVEVCDF